MKVGALAQLLAIRYENEETRKRSVMLEGPAGVGKSQVIAQGADILRQKYPDFVLLDTLRLSQCDTTDLRGVPSTVDGRTVWNVPSFFPDPVTQPRGIFLLDEITSAVPAVQAAAYQIVQDKAAGDYKFPPGWMIVLAGNRQDDRGVTFAMPSPLRNRMTTLTVDVVLRDDTDHQGWLDYAAQNGCDPRVMAFLMARGDLLHKFEKQDHGKPFPTPRSWLEGVSPTMKMEFPELLRAEQLRGDVGDEAALAFEAFLRYLELMPSIEDIERDPDSVAIPERAQVQYCTVMGLAARMSKDNFDNMYKYLSRMKKEFQTLCVVLAFGRDQSIACAPTFSAWAVENQEAWKR